VTYGSGLLYPKPGAPRYLEAFILTPDFFASNDVLIPFLSILPKESRHCKWSGWRR
jgi:hypothetical protein